MAITSEKYIVDNELQKQFIGNIKDNLDRNSRMLNIYLENSNVEGDIVGIDTKKINLLCIDIQDYADKVKKIFNELELEADSLSNVLEGDCYKEFVDKFSVFKSSFQTIYDNITSYIDDLNNLVANYKIFEEDLSDKVDNKESQISNEL